VKEGKPKKTARNLFSRIAIFSARLNGGSTEHEGIVTLIVLFIVGSFAAFLVNLGLPVLFF